MNKWLWAVCAVLFAPALCTGQNNVRMVTYFPVPYAAYNDLEVSHNCDVGLAGSCSIKSGGEFKVSDKMTVKRGALTLNNGPITGEKLQVGRNLAAPATVSFKDELRVGRVSAPIHILQSASTTTIGGGLTLQGVSGKHTFPACSADGHLISWRQLDLGKGNKVYLTCGTGSCGDNEAQQKDRCENHERSTWHSDTCTCDCPDGQHWSEETGQCESNCNETAKAHCIGGHVEGTWDDDTCTCSCPEGYKYSEYYGECEPLCDQTKKLRCLDDSNDLLGSTWDDDTCTCVCPPGAKVNSYGECSCDEASGWEWVNGHCEYCEYYRKRMYTSGRNPDWKCLGDDPGNCDSNDFWTWEGNTCLDCVLDTQDDYPVLVKRSGVWKCEGHRRDEYEDDRRRDDDCNGPDCEEDIDFPEGPDWVDLMTEYWDDIWDQADDDYWDDDRDDGRDDDRDDGYDYY